MRRLSRTLLVLSLFVSLPAKADDVLRFKTPSTYKHELAIKHVMEIQKQNQTSSSYQIAEIDLNNDFINEYVLKPSTCNAPSICPHQIIAITDHKAARLAELISYKITIDYSDLYGVRNIKNYNNPDNNFRYTALQWNPFSGAYDVAPKPAKKQ